MTMNDQISSDPEHGTGAVRFFVPPIAALQFLTILPPIIHRLFTPEEMGRSTGYFPLVGALLGGMLALLNRGLAQVWPPAVSAALVLAAWVIVTGALHLDGFLDTCDGIFGGHTPESRLHIMRDERIGAYALAGGVVLLLLKYAALSTTSNRTLSLLLAPILARWAMTAAIVLFPYARDKGLGRAMKDHAGKTQLAVATGTALAIAWIPSAWSARAWRGFAASALVALATWIVARHTLKRLPGLTGDVYGAICELAEALVLILVAAFPA
jgi:adenosylcobinamide-GDP ribazoletransferase